MPTDTYRRRPFLMGNTDVPVLSQPEIRSPVAKDTSGEITGLPLPSALAVATESTAAISVPFVTGRTLAYIVATLNAALAPHVETEEIGGTLVLRSTSVGDDAFIRIEAPTGYTDASSYFGLEIYPHPMATVTAGDVADAPVRVGVQDNPVGTKMLAYGEDRVGSAFNRIFQQFGINQDTLHTWLQKPVAAAAVLEVDAVTHAAKIVTNADGSIDQIDLSDLSVFDPDLDGARMYVGDLAADSTLAAIARFWGVVDSSNNELLAGERTVRVGPVTRGIRGASKPTYVNEHSAPSGALGNTSGASADGLNALGVARTKSTETISGIRERTTIVCSGATFETDGVVAGDVATISGASTVVPFSHNGAYLVELVVDETTLVLRPTHDRQDVRELNPTTGTYGTVTVTSGGEWESALWVTLEPSLPRMPEDGALRIIVPVEIPLGQLRVADIARGDIQSAEEVSGWVRRTAWRDKGIDSVYQGQSGSSGSGFWGRVTHRPLTLVNFIEYGASTGSSSRTSSGNASMDYATRQLSAAAADRFYEEDVGKTILLTDTTNLPGVGHPWTITKLIDGGTVELAPPPGYTGFSTAAAGTVSAWDIRDNDDSYMLPSMVRMISPESIGVGGATATQSGGLSYIREFTETDLAGGVQGGPAFLHLEKVKLRNDAGTPRNIVEVAATSLSGAQINLPFDPETTSNIIPEHAASNYTVAFRGGITLVRVLHGPNRGVFRVYATNSVAGGDAHNAVLVRTLTGGTVTFTSVGTTAVAFYNAYAGIGVSTRGGGDSSEATFQSNLSLFGDSFDTDTDLAILMNLGWRGAGKGVVARLGDPEFWSYAQGDHPSGELGDLKIYAPATGVDLEVIGDTSSVDATRTTHALKVTAYTHFHDLEFEGVAPVTFTSYNSWIHQGGKDPGVLITKSSDMGGSSVPSTSYSKFTPSAALLLGRSADTSSGLDISDADTISGRGSAVEQRGSTYVYRGDYSALGSGRVKWADGGVYVEDVVGTGRWTYPMHGLYPAATSPWYGDTLYEGWDGSTTLGYPGRVWPRRAEITSNPSGTLNEPDFAKFNLVHVGYLTVSRTSSDPEGETLPRPYNRLVGCRVLILEAGHSLENEELVIQAVRPASTGSVHLALYYDGSSTVVGAGDTGSVEFVILGQRYEQAYLNIGDYFLVGTGLRTSAPFAALDENLKEPAALPLTTALAQEPNDATGDFPAVVGENLAGWGAILDLYWSSAQNGTRVGDMTALSAMTDVDTDFATFASAISWGAEHSWAPLVLHGWSTASGAQAPRSPFPNDGVFARPDPTGNSDAYLDQDYLGNLTVDDYAISFPGSPASPDAKLSWSVTWGGSLRLSEDALTVSQQVRIWQRGHMFALTGHVAVKVRLILQWDSTYTSAVIALRTVDGTALGTATLDLSTSSSTPTEFEEDILIQDTDALYQGGPGSVGATLSAQQICATIDVTMASSGNRTFRILEWQTAPLTRQQVISGPLAVMGTVQAHGFRFTDPTPGYDTRGPLSAFWLSNDDYGFLKSHSGEPWRRSGDPSYFAGHEEKHYRPGKIELASSTGWFEPWVDTYRWWGQGLHSASITMWTGAFDPVFYISLANGSELTGGASAVVFDEYVEPGKTGFGVPFEPPHGSVLTSLAFSVSIRPHYLAGTAVSWGVWSSYYRATGILPPGVPDLTELLEKASWDTATGFKVLLWRQSILDTGIDFGEFAESTFISGAPEFGYSELLAEFDIDISGEALPSYAHNVIASSSIDGEVQYIGEELFIKRNLNLLAASGAVSSQRLRVDRRNYTYFMTIEWWGGPRETSTGYSATPIYISHASVPYFDGLPAVCSTLPKSGAAAIGRVGYVERLNYIPDGLASSVDIPPRVKFRGARLGWVTDRGSHGGWGS